MGIKSLMDDYGLTQQKVADILGKARSSIANSVRILNLDERVIQLALEGKLTEGHCKSILAVPDKDKQYAMALYIIESGDSVREAEKKMARNKTKTNKDRKYEPIYRDIETSFRDFFGTKVKLDAGKRKGTPHQAEQPHRDSGTAHSGGGFRRGQRDGADCKGHAGTACRPAAAVGCHHPEPGCTVCRGCNF
mgnify:CR=1 FL=1